MAGVAGRIHCSDNSFLAELWGLIHAIRLIPYEDDAIILGDCQGVLFRAEDGLPAHASQRLRLACGEALNALQFELDARRPASTEYRWYPSHLDTKAPVSELPPLGQAQVWCDETCKVVPDLLDAEQDARPGEFDEAFSLWTAPTATEPQRRVPTNKLRAYLYQAIAKE